MDVHADVQRILIHRDAIQQRVRAMAAEIAAYYARREGGLTIVPILSGSIIFLADLIRELPMKMKIALIQLSSYRDRAIPGERRTLMQLTGDVRGRHVLVIDDILDTGGTLAHVQEMVRQQQPASLRTVVLLRKPGKASPAPQVDYVGFDIEDIFVVGYGLDYNDFYRNYPHIGVLRPELMT